MARRIALWRMELGAGVAAIAIGLLTLPMALLAPLYPLCGGAPSASGACPTAPRYVALLAAQPGADVWALLIGLLALTLVGAAGAIADARLQPALAARMFSGAGLLALWGATLVVFAICALGSRGPLGLLYLPSTLALALAAYVALLRRVAARRAAARAEESEESA
jgi:hypothetical protein